MKENIVVENGTAVIEEETMETIPFTTKVTDTARKALHVGLGAVVMTQDGVVNLANKAQTNTSDMVHKLAERGAAREEKGREQVADVQAAVEKTVQDVQDVVENPPGKLQKAQQKAQNLVDTQVKAALQRMNLPTKEDVDALHKKLEALERKIDQLRQK